MAFKQVSASNVGDVDKTKLMIGASRSALICTALAFGLVPQVAFAQETTPDTTATVEEAPEPEDAIVVTGVRAAINKALDTKRKADLIVDSISAEDIGKLPDNNIAEAIQRIPGVSIDRSGGEGRYITINGLGPQFSLTLLNGRQIATSDSSRSFSFDTVASSLVRQIDVYKTVNADVTEGGLGGTVNVRTARPFDFNGFTATAMASYQYDENSKKGHPQASVLISDTFFDDRVGLLLSFTHQRRTNTAYQTTATSWSRNYFVDPVTGGYVEDDLEKAWRSWDVQYGRTVSERERNGGTAVLQFKPTDTLTLTADYLYSKFNVKDKRDSGGAYLWAVQDTPASIIDENGYYTQLDIGLHLPYSVCNSYNPALPVSATNVSCRASYSWNNNETYRPTTTQLAGFNTEWKPTENFTALADVYWSKAVNDNKGRNRNHTFEMGNMPGYYVVFPEDGSSPVFDLDGFDLAGHPEELRVRRFGNSGTYTKAVNKGASLDFVYEPSDALTLKFGGAYAQQTKNNDSYATPSNITGLYWCCSTDAPPDLTQVLSGVMWADGRFGVTGEPYPVFLINGDGLREWAANETNLLNRVCPATSPNQCGYTDFVANGRTFDAVRSASSYKVTEKDLALYFQLTGKTEIGTVPVTVVAGMRYSRTSLTSSGTNVVLVGFKSNIDKQLVPIWEGENATNLRPIVPVAAKNTYDYFLPSVNVKADLTDRLIFRLAATKTMTRPTLADVSPSFSYGGFPMNPSTRGASGNNPNLKPFTSDNYDASLEWYYSRNGAFAIAGFVKQATNFIVRQTKQEIIDTVETVSPNIIDVETGLPYSLEKARIFQVSRPHNAASATIKGITASWTHSFDFGLGFQANYTKVWSKVRAEGNQKFALPGISDTLNLVGFYEKGPISARLAYNWRSGFLITSGTSDDRTKGTDGSPYQQVDARIGFKLGHDIELGVDVVNLTKSKVRSQGPSKANFISYSDFGRQFSVSVSKKF